jgi:hypothetical protein
LRGFFFVVHLFTCEYIVWVISPDNCPHWEGGSSRCLQFIFIKILSLLSF